MSAPQDVNTPPGSPLSEVPITPFPQLQQKPADADATFAHEIFTLIGHEDVSDITVLQAEILEKTRQSNQTLYEFNEFASRSFTELSKDFDKHTRSIIEMRKDLDAIFKRIRSIKSKVFERHPDSRVLVFENDEDD